MRLLRLESGVHRAICPMLALGAAAALGACAGGRVQDGRTTGPVALGSVALGPARLGLAREVECAPFARAVTGIALYGAAADWWDEAAGRYPRGRVPLVGSVLVFARSTRLPYGHVSVVSAVVSAREVRLTQANWLHGHVGVNQPARDVSAGNDWTAVQVWWPPSGAIGQAVYATYGFVSPER